MRAFAILALCVACGSAGAQNTKAPATKAPASRTAPVSPQRGLTIAPESDSAAPMPVVMREIYDYDSEGRRDPFVSLLQSAELRPTMKDLRLVVLLYDESGRRPVAVLRDVVTKTQYRVTTGMTLGRLRVALITRKAVIFNIEEFGLNRTDSLVIGDTTKVRTR
ncbi:MAG: hypothetical protein WD801_08905 [Gemmatimonadaceae bacterium]